MIQNCLRTFGIIFCVLLSDLLCCIERKHVNFDHQYLLIQLECYIESNIENDTSIFVLNVVFKYATIETCSQEVHISDCVDV